MAGQKSALGTALWPEVYPTARPLVASGGNLTPDKKIHLTKLYISSSGFYLSLVPKWIRTELDQLYVND